MFSVWVSFLVDRCIRLMLFIVLLVRLVSVVLIEDLLILVVSILCIWVVRGRVKLLLL